LAGTPGGTSALASSTPPGAACQCGWAFYASVRTLRIADRTHGFNLDKVHASRHHAAF
jgi:hypothetical protein